MVAAGLMRPCGRDVPHMARYNHTFARLGNFQACHEGIIIPENYFKKTLAKAEACSILSPVL
jgi:hypothetical protein